MAGARRIDTIEIGIAADVSGLRQSLQQAAQDVRGYQFPERSVKVNVYAKADQPSFVKVESQIVKGLRGKLDKTLTFHAQLIPVRSSVRDLITDAQKLVASSKRSISIPVKADLESAQKIHDDIQKKVDAKGAIKVKIQWEAPPIPTGPTGRTGGRRAGPAAGGGGGGGEPPAAGPTVGARPPRPPRTPRTPSAGVAFTGTATKEKPAQRTPTRPAGRTTSAPPPPVPTSVEEDEEGVWAAYAGMKPAAKPATARGRAGGRAAATGKPTTARGATPVAALPPSAGPELFEGGIAPMPGDLGFDLDAISAMVGNTTWESYVRDQAKAMANKGAVLKLRGGVAVLARKPLPGSYYESHPQEFRKLRRDLSSMRRKMAEGGAPATAGRGYVTAGPRRERGYRQPGLGVSAYRLAGRGGGKPPSEEQLQANLMLGRLNEEEFLAQRAKEAEEYAKAHARDKANFESSAVNLEKPTEIVEAIEQQVASGRALSQEDMAVVQAILYGGVEDLVETVQTPEGLVQRPVAWTVDRLGNPVGGGLIGLSNKLRMKQGKRFYRVHSDRLSSSEVNAGFLAADRGVEGLILRTRRALEADSERTTREADKTHTSNLRRSALSVLKMSPEKRIEWANKHATGGPFATPEAALARADAFLKANLSKKKLAEYLASIGMPKAGLGVSFAQMAERRKQRYLLDELQGILPNTELGIQGVSSNLLPVVQQAKTLARFFPQTAESISSIESVPPEIWKFLGVSPVRTAGQTHYSLEGGKRISRILLDQQRLLHPETTQDYLSSSLPSGLGMDYRWSPRSATSFGATFAHEWAHAQDWLHEGMPHAMTGSFGWKSTSRYGSTDPREMWATLFEDFVRGVPPKVGSPGVIGDFIRSLSRREGGDWPTRALGGGIQEIGKGGSQIWQAPGPGWVIPHHLMDQIPGMAGGGKIPTLRSLNSVRRLLSKEQTYLRWTPNIEADMAPGAHSQSLFPDPNTGRPRPEIGISVHPLSRELPWLGINNEYDLSGQHWKLSEVDYPFEGKRWGRFKRRTPYLLTGTEVGSGWDDEPLLDPTSIRPIAKLSRNLVKKAMAEYARYRYTYDPTALPWVQRAFGGKVGFEIPEMQLGGNVRPWRFVVDGKPGTIRGTEADVNRWIRDMAAKGHKIEPGLFKPEGPSGFSSHSSHLRKRAGGGRTPDGMYVVGEMGPELFVPQSMGWIIPRKVMDSLPKRGDGGSVEPPSAGAGGEGPFRFQSKTGKFMSPAAVSSNVAGQGQIQRVYVVNWPSILRTGTGTGFAGGSVAGQPFATSATLSNNQKADNTDAAKKTASETAKSVRQATAGGASTRQREPRESPAVTAARREVIRSERLEEAVQERQDAALRTAELRARAREAPTRAFPVAVGQFLAERFGGRRQYLERAGRAAVISQELSREYGVRERILRNITETEDALEKTDITEAQRAKHTEDLGAYNDQLETVNGNIAVLSEKTTQAEAAIGGAGAVAKIFGSNLVGIMGGMTIFTAAMSAMQAGFSALGPPITAAADTLLGFQATSDKTRTALGKSVVEMKGNIEAVFGVAGQQAGLSFAAAERAQQILGPSAIARGAATIEGGATDIFRSMVKGGAPSGLYGGYGGLFGGPALAELFGGGKGFTEQIAGNITELTNKSIQTIAQQRATQLNEQDMYNQVYRDFTGDEEWLKKAQENPAWGQREINSEVKRRLTVQATDLGFPDVSQEMRNAQSALVSYVKDLNEAADRGAKALGQTTVKLENVGLGDATAELRDQFKAAGAAAGDTEYAKQLADAGYVIRDASGKVVSSAEEYQQAFSQIAKGRTMTDISTYAKQITQGLKVQVQANRALSEFSRNLEIPFQFGAQRMATGAQYLEPSAGITTFGVSGGTKTEISTTISSITNLKKSLDATSTSAMNTAQTFVDRWSGQGSAFGKARKEVEAAGKTIAGIQTKIFDTQISLNNAMFSNTRRLARRAYQDALGLAGRGGAGSLGAVQREQTMLGFALQQRQITTQLAVAQFAAPGQTGEERYMRQKQAITEAKISQRQLDLQRKAFGIETKRGVTDTGIQLSLIQKQWNAENELIAKNKELAAAQEDAALKQANLTKIYEEAASNYQLFMGEAAKAASEYGISLDEARKKLMATWTNRPEDIRKGDEARSGRNIPTPKPPAAKAPPTYLDIPKDTLFSTPRAGLDASRPLYVTDVATPKNNPYRSGGSGGGGAKVSAAGFLGNVSGATGFIAGEAGTETVAILRNPRSMNVSSPVGGGGSTFNINVNYSGGGSTADAHTLALAIATEVEREMSRRGMLLGLRGAAY